MKFTTPFVATTILVSLFTLDALIAVPAPSFSQQEATEKDCPRSSEPTVHAS
jgi:hypothetical protein